MGKVQRAEHPIDSLSSCGTSIVERLPAEFEPLTVALRFLLTTTNKKPYKRISVLYLFDLCRPSPYQLFNLRSYSTSEETRSEHWVATPILPGPSSSQQLNVSPLNTYQNLISRRIDYLQLSPAIQKYL